MSKSKPSALSLAAAVSAVAATGRSIFVRTWTALCNRRAVKDLLAFDDHMLRDIGLTRGDVAAVLADPIHRDPSRRLTVLAVERRAGQRAQRREAVTEARLTRRVAASETPLAGREGAGTTEPQVS